MLCKMRLDTLRSESDAADRTLLLRLGKMALSLLVRFVDWGWIEEEEEDGF